MNYSVEWEDEALAHLTAIWLQSGDRQAVTAAQARIDQLLAANPLGHRFPVSEGLYAIEVHPLHAAFEVSDTEQRVKVVSVSWLP
jgi:plasmid stabilization system protein ParE